MTTAMESSETTEENNGHRSPWFRCSFPLSFFLIAFLLLSLILGFVAVFVGNTLSNPTYVPSQCKIISSGVDLRSSKVCELGLLNYKAKHVFYPFERKKFRCRHEYYWASIFNVEYKDRFGETWVSLAEVPNEALPLDCRPDFGVAWLTKDKFKVNETYDCWYTFGLSKLYIYHNNFFNCHAKDPSTVEMLRRFFILSPRIFESWLASQSWSRKWEAIAGAVAGFSTSLISISLIRLLRQFKFCLPQICRVRILPRRKQQVSLFVAYISLVGWLLVGWLAIQYS